MRVKLGSSWRGTRQLGSLLWPYASTEKGLLATGAGLSLLVVIFRVSQPWPLKWILDVLTGHRPHHALGGLEQAGEIGIPLLSLLYVLITLAAAGAEYVQLLVLAGLGNRVIYALRSALFTQVLRQPLAFHETREAGELLTRVVYDTARLRQGLNGLLTRVFQTLFTFFATAAVLLWLNPVLAGAVGFCGALALVLMGRSNRRITAAARKQRRREGRLASLVAEDLLGIRELQTYRPDAPPDERFARQNARSLRTEQKVRRLGAGLLLRVEVLLALSVTVVLWLGSRLVQAGTLTPGDLVLFVSYALGLYRPFSQFARQTARSGKTFACGDRLAKIMNLAPAISDRPDAVPAPAFRGELAVEGVRLRNPRRRRGGRAWAHDGISFTVEAGERVGLVGPNGAGKSTLLRLLLRLSDPDEGRIRLDGRDIRDYTLQSLRRQMSVVFQDNLFFGLSVRHNIALGDEGASLESVQAAARRAHADALITRLPQGYDTPVRHRGGLFSGGERQRIALARALLRDGRLWLLDEPTTGLDHGTAAELVDLLLEATAGRTVLWITHDPEILPRLDRVVLLEEGRVVFSGPPADYGEWLARRVSRPAESTGEI
jgi:ATP-binding cassette subfamily B protein